jgi:hypothetical protein
MPKAKYNITKKQQDEFVAGVTKGLVDMGAVIQPTDERMFSNTQFKLETTAGTLLITLYHRQEFLFTVYSRFEDPNKSKGKFICNPYSGKYNFNKVNNCPMEQIIEFALMHFECTLKKETA